MADAAKESPGEAFEAVTSLPADVAANVTDLVESAFTDALTVTTLSGAVVLFVGAFATWWLMPGRGDVVDEMSKH